MGRKNAKGNKHCTPSSETQKKKTCYNVVKCKQTLNMFTRRFIRSFKWWSWVSMAQWWKYTMHSKTQGGLIFIFHYFGFFCCCWNWNSSPKYAKISEYLELIFYWLGYFNKYLVAFFVFNAENYDCLF